LGQDHQRLRFKGGCLVVLDTSVLLMIYEGVDVIEKLDEALGARCEYYVTEGVIKELIRLSTIHQGRKGRAARLALEYLKGKVNVLYTREDFPVADEEIENVVMSIKGFIVATNDKELRRRLKRLGVRVVTWWEGRGVFVEV